MSTSGAMSGGEGMPSPHKIVNPELGCEQCGEAASADFHAVVRNEMTVDELYLRGFQRWHAHHADDPALRLRVAAVLSNLYASGAPNGLNGEQRACVRLGGEMVTALSAEIERLRVSGVGAVPSPEAIEAAASLRWSRWSRTESDSSPTKQWADAPSWIQQAFRETAKLELEAAYAIDRCGEPSFWALSAARKAWWNYDANGDGLERVEAAVRAAYAIDRVRVSAGEPPPQNFSDPEHPTFHKCGHKLIGGTAENCEKCSGGGENPPSAPDVPDDRLWAFAGAIATAYNHEYAQSLRDNVPEPEAYRRTADRIRELVRALGVELVRVRGGAGEDGAGPWKLSQYDKRLGDNLYVTRPGNSPGVTRYSGPFTEAEAQIVCAALNAPVAVEHAIARYANGRLLGVRGGAGESPDEIIEIDENGKVVRGDTSQLRGMRDPGSAAPDPKETTQ